MLNQISGLKLSSQRGLYRLKKPLVGRSFLWWDLCAKEGCSQAVFFNVMQVYSTAWRSCKVRHSWMVTQSKSIQSRRGEVWEYIPGWREWNSSTPHPASMSPLPYIQLQSIDFFSPFTLMDNTHPSAVRYPQMQMYAHTHTHATAWALNVTTLTSPQPSVILQNPSCFGYLNPPHTRHMCTHSWCY